MKPPESQTDFRELYEAERARADRLEAKLNLLEPRKANAAEGNDALRQQWAAFDKALSNTPDFNYIFDMEGRFTYINRALLDLWQKSFEEAAGKNFFELNYPTALAERLQRQIQEVIDTKGIVRDETPYTGADGKTGHYEYIFVPVFGEDGSVVAVTGSTRDVTHQKRIEKALRDSQENLKQIFEQAPVPIVVFRGRDFVVELANPGYHALLRGREVVGRRFADVMPELGEYVWQALYSVYDSGEPFLANEWLVPYDQAGNGEIVDVWFNVLYHPLHALDGSINGVIAVAYDVSAQVRARQTLERTNKALEEFAYVASHDLQEPLRTVNSFTQLLVRELGPKEGSEIEQYAGFIQAGVGRMEALLRELLIYSRTGRADEDLIASECADLNNALTKAISAVESRAAETSATITADSLPIVYGDEGQYTHVFQNLLSNALKYTKPGVAPAVHISAARQAGEWQICVQDNGIGFDPQYAERIFGLFKRLHGEAEYPGTGLGLAISRRIIERFNGKIWAKSEPGVGSAFFVALPASKETED